jgi:hypothetical protein
MKIEQAKQLTEQALDKLIQVLEAGKSEALRAYLAQLAAFTGTAGYVVLNITSLMSTARLCESGFHKSIGYRLHRVAVVNIVCPHLSSPATSREEKSNERDTHDESDHRRFHIAV